LERVVQLLIGCRACESLQSLPVGASRPATPAHAGIARVTAKAVTSASRSAKPEIDKWPVTHSGARSTMTLLGKHFNFRQ
jgi:hypothetical protein